MLCSLHFTLSLMQQSTDQKVKISPPNWCPIPSAPPWPFSSGENLLSVGTGLHATETWEDWDEFLYWFDEKSTKMLLKEKMPSLTLDSGLCPLVLLKTLVDKEQHVLFKLAQLLSYLATLDKLPASCHAGRRRTISSEKSCLISLPFLLTYTDISAVKSFPLGQSCW